MKIHGKQIFTQEWSLALLIVFFPGFQNFRMKLNYLLRPSNDIPQSMRPVIVNGFTTLVSQIYMIRKENFFSGKKNGTKEQKKGRLIPTIQ